MFIAATGDKVVEPLIQLGYSDAHF